MALTVGGYLLTRLRDWGVEHVFAFPGDGINGILAAWTDESLNAPPFVQARHEEMAAFEAVGYAKYGRTGRRVGPGSASAWPPRARAPSTCSTGSTTPSSTTCRWSRSSGRPSAARWAAPTSRRSTSSRCSRTSRATTCRWSRCPSSCRTSLDRAIRIAMAQQAPTAIIIPSDVQELEYTPPGHAFKQVPSSLGISWPRSTPTTPASAGRRRSSTRAPRSPCSSARARTAPRAEVEQVAELLGAGVAKALLGKDVLPDTLPFVTGSIGLLGTRPELRDDDGLRHPAHGRLELPVHPVHAAARPGPRPSRSTSTARSSACATPTRSTSSATPPPRCAPFSRSLQRKADRGWREGIEEDVARWWETMRDGGDGRRRPHQPDAAVLGAQRPDARRTP